MTTALATAPCSWGVEQAEHPDNPPWSRVAAEAAECGYRGLELGPPGFMPFDSAPLTRVFEEAGLQLIAGTLYRDFVSPEAFPDLLAAAHSVCRLLAAVGGGQRYLVLIDCVKPERNRTAGHPKRAPRLEAGDWQRMMQHIRTIARIATVEYGIRAVVHPHAGGYLEFDDETSRCLDALPAETAGLCLDTGHLHYSGTDPGEGILRYGERIDYLHFKDIDAERYRQALAAGSGFFDACLEGVMCPVGSGCIDYDRVKTAVEAIGYGGWITVEQERDPRRSAGAPEDLQRSRRFLESRGF